MFNKAIINETSGLCVFSCPLLNNELCIKQQNIRMILEFVAHGDLFKSNYIVAEDVDLRHNLGAQN